jgi:hypothetical protein
MDFTYIQDTSRSLDSLLSRSLAVRTADKRVQENSLVRLYCENHGLAAPEDRRALRDYYATLTSHAHDDLGPTRVMLSLSEELSVSSRAR